MARAELAAFEEEERLEAQRTRTAKLRADIDATRARVVALRDRLEQQHRTANPDAAITDAYQRRLHEAETEMRELHARLGTGTGTAASAACGPDCACEACSTIADDDEREACFIKCSASVALAKLDEGVVPRPKELLALGAARALGLVTR